MAYYSGQVSSIEDLKNTLIDILTTQHPDWTFGNNFLENQNLNIRLNISTSGNNLSALGYANGQPALNAVRIGIGVSYSGKPTLEPTYPADYHLHVFEKEVYLVIKYSIDIFQYLAFGRTSLDFAKSNGTGMWLSATFAQQVVSVPYDGPFKIEIGQSAGQGYPLVAPIPFWSDSSNSAGFTWRNSLIHCNLDGEGWSAANANNPLGGILNRQPNAWNASSPLLPFLVYRSRASSKCSLVLSMENCRALKINNYEPEQIIIMGAEKWKVYPSFKKNSSVPQPPTGSAHSGSFGWAIRYDGP